MKTPTIKLYYTYQELLDEVSLQDIAMPRFPHDMEMSSNWFTALIEAGGLEVAVYTLSEFFTDDLINQIINALMGIVYNRHAEDYIACVNQSDDENEDLNKAMYKALSKLINVIDLTIPKYVPILQQNEIYSTNPVAPAESESSGETRFNDTPQNIGEYGDVDHTTNISNSRSSSVADTGSVMERLSELFKNFKSIILEWSNEFNQCFIKEEQIHD